MKTLKLDNPILINGKEFTEFKYDANEITAEQFSVACARSAALDKNKTITFKVKENDFGLQLYLGMMAIISVNPEIDVNDLERVKGFDVLKIQDIGWLFMLRRSEGTSEESNSEEQ